MKKLFIYYSNSGNGDLVANYLKDLGFDIRKVETNYKLSRHMFLAMMKGGSNALFNKKAKLINYNNDVSEYDEIYIGSPIWNSRLTPPINTVLRDTDLTNKKIAFIFYSGGGTSKKATKKVNKLYNNPTIINLKQPTKYNDELKRIGE
jgi:flavorubredoxin